LEQYHRFFKRDNYFPTKRFKCRFYNSLTQGLSGKNEQPVRPPWRGPSQARGPMQLHRMHRLEAGPGFRKWRQFTWKRNGSSHEYHLDTETSRLLIAN